MSPNRLPYPINIVECGPIIQTGVTSLCESNVSFSADTEMIAEHQIGAEFAEHAAQRWSPDKGAVPESIDALTVCAVLRCAKAKEGVYAALGAGNN